MVAKFQVGTGERKRVVDSALLTVRAFYFFYFLILSLAFSDHLCQYLAMRLQAWEQRQGQLGKSKDVLSPWLGPGVKATPRAASGAAVAGGGGGSANSGGGGARTGSTADAGEPRASLRRPDTEQDKITGKFAIYC